MLSLCMCEFSLGALAPPTVQRQVRFIGNSKLPKGMNGCIFISPVMTVQGLPNLSPNVSWDPASRPATLQTISG